MICLSFLSALIELSSRTFCWRTVRSHWFHNVPCNMIGRIFHKNKNELKVNHLYLNSVKLSYLKVLHILWWYCRWRWYCWWWRWYCWRWCRWNRNTAFSIKVKERWTLVRKSAEESLGAMGTCSVFVISVDGVSNRWQSKETQKSRPHMLMLTIRNSFRTN